MLHIFCGHTTCSYGRPLRHSFCYCLYTAAGPRWSSLGIASKSQTLSSDKKKFGKSHPPLLSYHPSVSALCTFCSWPHDSASLSAHLRCREWLQHTKKKMLNLITANLLIKFVIFKIYYN